MPYGQKIGDSKQKQKNCPLGININRNKLHKNKILPVGH